MWNILVLKIAAVLERMFMYYVYQRIYYLPPARSRSIVHDVFTLHETVYANRAWYVRIKANIPEKVQISISFIRECDKEDREGLIEFLGYCIKCFAKSIAFINLAFAMKSIVVCHPSGYRES